MGSGRRLAVSVFVLGMVVGHGFDIALERDDWPFSHYGMYKEAQGRSSKRDQFVGVALAGEVPLDVRRQLQPFDPSRLAWALAKVRRTGERDGQARALSALLARYEHLRATGRHQGPRLIGLRVYRLHFRLTRDGKPRRTPYRRTLRQEVLAAPAEAT